MALSILAQETDRKEKLLMAFEEHESETRLQPEDKNLKFGFFSRIFDGEAEVNKIGWNSLKLMQKDGRSLGDLLVTPEIAKLSKKGDLLLATLGYRLGQWHLIQIKMIGSPIKDVSGETKVHLSFSTQAFLNP